MQNSSVKRFQKDLDAVRDSKLLLKIADALEGFEAAESLDDMTNIKKLKGGDNYYRLRIGDYRIGFKCQDDEVVFLRFGHRKEFYDSFP